MPRAQRGRPSLRKTRSPVRTTSQRSCHNDNSDRTSPLPLPHTVMPERETSDCFSEEILNALDAWNHVFLQSFLAMDDPVRQVRIEHMDLEYQWGRLARGKASMNQESSDSFLKKHDILEYALDDDFVARYNLSVMVHRLFLPELELGKCWTGLKGYIRMFRSQLEEDAQRSGEDKGIFWRMVMQMICVIMAVYIRSGADISNYQPADLMKEAWDMEGEYSNAKGPCPARIQDAAAQFIRSIASRAAKDDCRLYGLYQNTLQLVLEQVRYCVLNLEDPREINLVRDLSELRSSKVQKLYSDPSIRNYGWSTLENMDSHWFEISEAVRQDAEGNLQEEDEEDGKDGEQEEQKKEQKEETQYQDQDQKQPRQHASTTSPSPKVQSPSFLTQDPVIFKAHDFKVKYWDSSEESGSEQEFIQKEREDSSPVKTVRRASKPCAAEEKDDTNLQKNKGKGRKEASLPIEGHQGQLLPVQPSASATPATVSSTSTTTAAPSILTASLSSSSKEPFAPSKAPSKPVPARLTPDAVQSMPKTAPPSSDTAPTTSAAAVSSPGSAPAPQSPSAPPPRMEKKEAISLLDRVCRAIGVGSASVKQQSDSEFEDDGDDVPPIVLKPRRVSLPPANPDPKSTIKDDQKKENTERDGSGESQSIRRGTHAVAQFSTSTSALAPDITSTPASLTAPKLAQKSTIRKERRKNRTWTRAEVERLMELVPRFQHRLESGAAAAATGPGQKQRSRKVQWARLKRFDEQNGNILRHRDQVMLKDKYREQTDHGRHRAQVSEILRTKSTNAPRHQFPQQDNQLVQ